MIENKFYQDGAFLTINLIDEYDWSHTVKTYRYNANAIYLFTSGVQRRFTKLINNVFTEGF